MDYWLDEHLMKVFLNKWFVIFSVIWLVVFICTKSHIYFWWPIQFYLIDLIAVPILGTLSLAFYKWILKDQSVKLAIWHICFLLFGLTIVFEVLLPKNNSRYISDFWDVVMYALGALFFFFVMNIGGED